MFMDSDRHLAVVEHDDRKLYTINEIILKIGLAAVKDNGLALEFVREQTPELCMAAVKQNLLSIML